MYRFCRIWIMAMPHNSGAQNAEVSSDCSKIVGHPDGSPRIFEQYNRIFCKQTGKLCGVALFVLQSLHSSFLFVHKAANAIDCQSKLKYKQKDSC